MPEYRITPGIIARSLQELKVIQSWVEENDIHSTYPSIVLIGGWAVDSYNQWYGSIDIDLVTTSDIRSKLKYYLRKEQDYFESRKELQMPSGIEKHTKEGNIIIDFIPKGSDQPFEGKDNPFRFSIIDGKTERKQIRSACTMDVPNRTILLVLKLKAVWDRTYRIEHTTSADPDWDRGKLVKDYADLLALLDPKYGGTDINLNDLTEVFETYPFLIQSFLKTKTVAESRERYGRLNKIEIQRTFDVFEDYFSTK